MFGGQRKAESYESFRKRLLQTKKVRLVLITLIVLLGLGLLAAGIVSYRSASRRPVCSDATLREAVPVLGKTQTPELKPVVDKIKSMKGYDRDPNCLYVVVTYHINNYDEDSAKRDMRQLKKVYDSKKGFSSQFGSKVKSIAMLEDDIAFMVKRKSEIQNSLITIPNGE